MAVYRILCDAGCRPVKFGEEYGPGLFGWWPIFEYEPADFDQASYFTFTAFAESESNQIKSTHHRNKEGVLLLNRPAARIKLTIMSLYALGIVPQTVVSSQVRSDMEADGFIGLGFRPTLLATGRRERGPTIIPWEKLGKEPIWELAPSIVLPPLHPQSRLLNRKGEPTAGTDWSKGLFLLEGEGKLAGGGIHYRRADFDAVEQFDAAFTLEAFGDRPNINSRWIVVSRRVRDFINARNDEVRWQPVYIIED